MKQRSPNKNITATIQSRRISLQYNIIYNNILTTFLFFFFTTIERLYLATSIGRILIFHDRSEKQEEMEKIDRGEKKKRCDR